MQYPVPTHYLIRPQGPMDVLFRFVCDAFAVVVACPEVCMRTDPGISQLSKENEKASEKKLTSRTNPPVGLPSHWVGISKFAGSPMSGSAGTHDAIRHGWGTSEGHSSSVDCNTRTTSGESVCEDDAHELKWRATFSARDKVRL